MFHTLEICVCKFSFFNQHELICTQ
jgi:hypothetical protein